MNNILVIDDDRDTCNFLKEIFEEQGWIVTKAENSETALKLSQKQPFQLVVSDINLNEAMNGLALLKRFREFTPTPQVILISGFGTLETAIEAVKEGAFDFISKPFNVQEIIATARRALSTSEEISPFIENHLPQQASGLVGHSRQMIELYMEIARVASYRSTVLIAGESGTGKELVARAIHSNSPRKDAAFIAVNCGALIETLLEAELFGHAKGSFTGAVADKKGLFEEAENGTLFLDEIGETSPALQVKLLRALQESEIKRVGSGKSTKVDVRVIAATHRSLEAEVKAGRFREDLFYRISVITLRVPPLRERREDIPLLALHFLQKACRETNKQLTLSSEALSRLRNYEWSGNVRELENTIEHAVLHTRGKTITEEDLPVKMKTAALSEGNEIASEASKLFSDLPSLDELEKRYLLFVLEAAKGNKSRASEILQIDRRTFYRMAERFGINLEPEKP